MRTEDFSDEELSGFIARQIVETRQSSKAVAELLEHLNEHTEIVYVKAELVSDFRHDNNMLKSRRINDYHHAKDAFLNIVVGNVYNAKFTANPGCHASGFVIPVYPLVASGMIPKETPLTVFSLTGYSGGGKKMIAEYESPEKPELYNTPRIYGLNLKHKHLPEMQKICGLDVPPVFCPIVDDYYKGMAVTVMLQNSMLKGNPTAKDIHEALAAHYDGKKVVKVHPFGYEDPMIAAGTMAGKDSMELVVNGHEGQTIITALFDNLGKGASGAAVENMNLMLGFEETAGLNL